MIVLNVVFQHSQFSDKNWDFCLTVDTGGTSYMQKKKNPTQNAQPKKNNQTKKPTPPKKTPTEFTLQNK